MKRSVSMLVLGAIGAFCSILLQFQAIPALDVPPTDVRLFVNFYQYKDSTNMGKLTGTLSWDWTPQPPYKPDPAVNYLSLLEYNIDAGVHFNFSPNHDPIYKPYVLSTAHTINNWGGFWQVSSQILYHFKVEPNDAAFPTDLVFPLSVEVRGKTQTYGHNVGSQVIAYLFTFPGMQYWGLNNLGHYLDPLKLLNIATTPYLPGDKDTGPIIIITNVPVGTVKAISIIVEVREFPEDNVLPYNASGLAYLDPVITIDPTFMITYHGKSVPAASIVYRKI